MPEQALAMTAATEQPDVDPVGRGSGLAREQDVTRRGEREATTSAGPLMAAMTGSDIP